MKLELQLLATTILGASLMTLSGCASDDSGLECGPGTEERDGQCVPEGAGTDTDAETETETPAFTGTASVGDDDDEDDGGGGGVASASAGEDQAPYSSCFGGSDVECRSDESCREAFDTCGTSCSRDSDCPTPSDGTAVQRCEDSGFSGVCVLFCGVEGFDCPEGMACEAQELCGEGEFGETSGTGGDCRTVEFCVAQG